MLHTSAHHRPAGSTRPGMGRPPMFTVQKPYFNTTEVHAAVQDRAPGAATLNGSAAASNGRPGFVPGRAVLEVPGWQDSLLARSTLSMHPEQPAPSRLRIFSGTSNPVGG